MGERANGRMSNVDARDRIGVGISVSAGNLYFCSFPPGNCDCGRCLPLLRINQSVAFDNTGNGSVVGRRYTMRWETDKFNSTNAWDWSKRVQYQMRFIIRCQNATKYFELIYRRRRRQPLRFD